MNEQNRREYFRLEFNQSLCSNVEIVQIKGKTIQTSSTNACIKDVGPGGLCFISDLKLPVTNDVILEFGFTLLDQKIKLIGMIVRRKELEDELFEYGVQFTIFEDMKNILTKQINLLTTRLRLGTQISSCSFCTKSDNCFLAEKD